MTNNFNNDMINNASTSPYVWRAWFVGQGMSVTPQCVIYNGMMWHILRSCKLNIALGQITFSIIFWLIAEPYFEMFNGDMKHCQSNLDVTKNN